MKQQMKQQMKQHNRAGPAACLEEKSQKLVQTQQKLALVGSYFNNECPN
jgi:hypothetical protein